MDAFASILASEMRKKGAANGGSSATASNSTSSASSGSKYLKRSDLEKKRQEEYHAEQKRAEEERAEKAAKKRKLEEEAAEARERTMEKRQRLREEKERAKKEKEEQEEEEKRRKQAAKNGNSAEDGTPSTATAGEGETEQMDEETVITRLRELEQPIRLFGESHSQRLRRLRRLLNANKSGRDSALPAAPARTSSPPPLTGGQLLIDLADVTKNRKLVYSQLHAWFALVVSEWEKALAERPLAIKESYQGKQATNAMRQAVDYIQPLFTRLKRNDLDDDIFTRVVDIVVEAQARRYVKANDVYLRLSIGNAAWPIGVTMVGIHERSAREKLHEKGKSAHIMSDEVTRKYLQSIKRCLNFAQTRWPPHDPMQLMG